MVQSIDELARRVAEYAPPPWTHHKGEICDAKGEALLFVDDAGTPHTNAQIADLIIALVNERAKPST